MLMNKQNMAIQQVARALDVVVRYEESIKEAATIMQTNQHQPYMIDASRTLEKIYEQRDGLRNTIQILMTLTQQQPAINHAAHVLRNLIARARQRKREQQAKLATTKKHTDHKESKEINEVAKELVDDELSEVI